VVELKLIGQGRTADVFELDSDKILKLYRSEVSYPAIQHEYRVSQLMYAQGSNVPQPFELVEQGDRHGIVFERISGRSLLKQISTKPWAISKLARKMAELHVEMHTHTSEGMMTHKKLLADRIQSTALLAEVEKDRILRYLDHLLDGDRICHGDFHPDNVMIGAKAWIIDWMTGVAGDPASDVARSLLLLDYGTMPPGTPKPIIALFAYLRKKLSASYLKRYLELSGMRYEEIDKWMLPLAAGRLAEWIPQEEKGNLLLLVKQRLKSL